MASCPASTTVSEPFPIFKLAHHFLLYDSNVVSYIREKYNICGVLIGGLPQAPQQNVFLGIPLELMPEEARLLVEKGVAVIQDDVRAHKNAYLSGGLSVEETKAYQTALSRQGQAAAVQAIKRTDDRKKMALSKIATSGDWNDIPEDMLAPSSGSKSRSSSRMGKRKMRAELNSPPAVEEDDSEKLFGGSFKPTAGGATTVSPSSTPTPLPFLVTPATSYPPLKAPLAPSSQAVSTTPALSEPHDALPDTPASYPLFRHLHSKGYFLSPGLRFGCQYMAYPGDPLRFHSHFLCKGMDWDQEFDLLEIVGGGRLGTGVKKGFLVGGEEKISSETSTDGRCEVRTFCVEWGGM